MREESQSESDSAAWLVLLILFSAQFTMSMGSFGYGPLAPFLREEFKVSLGQIGSLVSVFYVSTTICSIPAGLLVDRIGSRSMLIICLILEGIPYGAMMFAGDFLLIAVCTAMSGAGYGIINQVSTKSIMGWFERRMRGTAMGIKQAGVSIGGAVVAVLLPAMSMTHGWRAAIATICVSMLLMAAVAWLFFRDVSIDTCRRRKGDRAGNRWESLRGTVLRPAFLMLMTILFFLAFGHGSTIGFLVLYLKEHALYPVEAAGTCLAFAMVAATVGRIGWGMVSDRAFRGDRLKPMALLSFIGALSALGIGLLNPGAPLWMALFWSAFLGLTLNGWNAVVMLLFAEIGGLELAASVQSIGMSSVGVGFVLGPILFGYTADQFGYVAGWMVVALFALIGAGGFFYLSRRKAGEWGEYERLDPVAGA
jgi:ACS family hexuronate transporter-like MFS transporter